MKRLDEWHFITNIPTGEGRKRKRPTRACFVCSKVQALNLNFKQKRTSFGVRIVEKHYVFHHVSKFTIQKLITNYML